jgi:hypothetical protein
MIPAPGSGKRSNAIERTFWMGPCRNRRQHA